MRLAPALTLHRSSTTLTITAGSGVIPGRVERIDVLDGVSVISTTSFSPPIEVAGQPVELTRWMSDPANPSVVVFFRRAQPGCRATPPLARAGFRLDRSDIEDVDMTTVRSAVEESQPAPVAGPQGVSATLDFGTSRSVCGVFDHRRVLEAPDDSLNAAAVAAVLEALEAEVEEDDDPGLAVERATRGEPLLRAEVWRDIFDRPPLAVNHLKVTKSRSSDLVIDEDVVEFVDEKPGADIRIRGVKRRLADLDEEVPGTGMTGGTLFSHVYRRFAELARGDLELDAPIRRVHVTFPTKMRPDRKDTLRKLLSGIAPVVEMNIDEAAAAAGFYLMKRFGSDSVLGVEAFKLQARCPEGHRAWEAPETWRNAREWHENLLVIDMGGGTTDCALVKVAVADITPPAAGDCPGRFHRLQPRVLASGGRLHLGGDLLTLNVFRVLKDRLGIDASATVFEGVEDTLRKARRDRFNALWDAAEKVKHRGLAGPEPCDVVVRLGQPRSDEDGEVVWLDSTAFADGATSERVTITANDLDAILAPVVDRLSALAAGIARGGLDVTDRARRPAIAEIAESVDRVVLSGGSMLAESLRVRVESSLRTRFRLDGLEPTFELEFDHEFCKTGTALGGMYLNAVTDLRHPPEHELVLRHLRDGLSYFDVDSSRLYVNLAADFRVLRDIQGVYPEPVFHRGQPLVSEDGIPFAVSAVAYPVLAQVRVYRYDMPGDTSTRDAAGLEDALWGAYDMPVSTAQALHQAGVQMWFEIDQDELLILVLSKGVPRPILTGPAATTAYLPEGGLVRDGSLRYDVHRDVFHAGIGVQRTEPLLGKGTDATTGVVASISGARHVYLNDTAGHAEHAEFPLLLEVPPGHHWLSIAEDGTVRTHATRPVPPFREGDPAQLLDAPEGTVFRARLTSPSPYDMNKDPFSGIH